MLGTVGLRKIDVGWVITAGGNGGDSGDVADITGKNVDVDRNDDVDAVGDKGLNWYKCRFNVWEPLAGIRMWCVCGGAVAVGCGGGGDDEWKVNVLTFPVEIRSNEYCFIAIVLNIIYRFNYALDYTRIFSFKMRLFKIFDCVMFAGSWWIGF